MKFCLIGERLEYSYSEKIHRARGLEYSLVPLKAMELSAFFKNNDFDGWNITVPYKKATLGFLDERSPLVDRLGAVNTVTRKNGRLYGDNTDLAGMAYAFERAGISLKDKRVLVLGTGGAANIACALCQEGGAKFVQTVSRTGKVNYQNCKTLHADAEVIINATPVGTYPFVDETPLSLAGFSRLCGVYDCVYNPSETAILKEAKALGVAFENGLSMLVEQALCAEDIWLERTHTKEETEELIQWLQKEYSSSTDRI